ncbi:MAG TPA: hypothetical protein VKE96_28090 [Vicinamibacterales bacterium]|nr:hypothetical protein [Vicinamibacterales bacterium]
MKSPLVRRPGARHLCADGLVVDVYEAWQAVLPKLVQMTPNAVFNAMFSALERVSPQARDRATHVRAIVGDVKTPHELMDAWKAFSVSHLASNIECPVLILYGEAEPAESNERVALSNIMRFIQQLKCSTSVRMFDYGNGWAATHCHVGGLAALHCVLFDWLDTAVHHSEAPASPRCGGESLRRSGEIHAQQTRRKQRSTSSARRVISGVEGFTHGEFSHGGTTHVVTGAAKGPASYHPRGSRDHARSRPLDRRVARRCVAASRPLG